MLDTFNLIMLKLLPMEFLQKKIRVKAITINFGFISNLFFFFMHKPNATQLNIVIDCFHKMNVGHQIILSFMANLPQ